MRIMVFLKSALLFSFCIRIWKDNTEKSLLQSAVLCEQRMGGGRALDENRGSQNYGERLRWNLGKTPVQNEIFYLKK